MPARPEELDFLTPAGKRATPERMQALGDHVDQRFRALETQRETVDRAIAELKAFGDDRVNQVLVPIFQTAQQLLGDAQALYATIADATTLEALRAQVKADVLTEIAAANLYVVDGANAGLRLFSGEAPPDAGTGQEGDLYIYVPVA